MFLIFRTRGISLAPRCNIITKAKELSMKMLIATMFKKVPVRKTQQRASICKRCGARIYSLDFLKAHLDAHNKKDH